jgi:hypothetical protein
MWRWLMRWLMAIVVTALSAGVATAGPSSEHLNWGSHITPARCTDDGYRYLEINVTHKVVNDGDSGFTRYWAALDYNRHIQLWEVGVVVPPGDDERFCALVRYQGAWVSTAGPSPMGTDLDELGLGVDGTFEGGYRAVVTGRLKANPPLRTRGNLGTFNYGWTGTPGSGAATPFDWIKTYFEGDPAVQLEWWGWIYHGGPNGTWVNSCPESDGPECQGSAGDITD